MSLCRNRFGNLLIPKTAKNQTRQESSLDQTHTHNPKKHGTKGLFLPPAIKQAVPLHALVNPRRIWKERSTIPYRKAVGGMSRKTQNEQVSRTLAYLLQGSLLCFAFHCFPRPQHPNASLRALSETHLIFVITKEHIGQKTAQTTGPGSTCRKRMWWVSPNFGPPRFFWT